MILAPNKSSARRLATVGLVALLFAACSVPNVTPSPSASPLATVPPTTPPYTLGPDMSPSCPVVPVSSAAPTETPTPASSAAPSASPTVIGSPPPPATGTATVTMTTNFGNIVIKVDSSLGPNAAGAFLALARCGYYNNVLFHRIVPGFVIQAGDGTYARMPTPNFEMMGTGGPGWTIPDDPVTTAYKRGTVAIANTGSPDTGSSQFFIVLSDTAFPSTTTSYAIFGNVTSGMDVVDRIALVPTGGPPEGSGLGSRPLQPVVITSTIVTTP